MYFEAVLDFVADLDQVRRSPRGSAPADAAASRRAVFLRPQLIGSTAAQRDFARHRDVRAPECRSVSTRSPQMAVPALGPSLGGTLRQVNVQVGFCRSPPRHRVV
jgi:hypothetical protein